MTLEDEKLLNDQENPDKNELDELVADIDEINIEDDLTDFVSNEENNESVDEEVSEEYDDEIPQENDEILVSKPEDNIESIDAEESEEYVDEIPQENDETLPSNPEDNIESIEAEVEDEFIDNEIQIEDSNLIDSQDVLTMEEQVDQEDELDVLQESAVENTTQEEPLFSSAVLTEEDSIVEVSNELDSNKIEDDFIINDTDENLKDYYESESEISTELDTLETEEVSEFKEDLETENPLVNDILFKDELNLETDEVKEIVSQEKEEDNIVKVSNAEPIISETYKPYDTFVERVDEESEETIDNESFEEVVIEETLEPEVSDETEEDDDLEEPVVEEEQTLSDEPLLSQDEMELPERFRKMLEESRMEKRGLTVKPQEKKKDKKNVKIENILAKELNLDMTEEAVNNRLIEFEQYFYENILDAEEIKETYENSYYEAKYDYFIDLAEKGHDLNEYINQGFDAWLAKNYKKYTFKGKAKKIKEGFENLKSIPRFNNREILPYVEKRGKLTIEFLNQFNNDIYLNSDDKFIFAKKHSLYPIINYENEKVCYEYLESLEVENIEQYAEMMYQDTKQEAIEFVKSTREYLDPLSIDYEFKFKSLSENAGYKLSKKMSKTGWVVSVWMLILCAIIQALHYISIPGDIVNKYVYAVNEHYLMLTLLTSSVIILNILLLLPSRIKNKKLYKLELAVDRIVGRRSLCRNLENKLNDDNKVFEYHKAIKKCKKNKIRVNETLLKEAAISVVDDCAKLRHKVLPSTRISKLLQFIFVFAVAFISAFTYTMLLDGILVKFMETPKADFKFVLVVALGCALIFSALIGLTSKKKSIARWRYRFAVLLSFIATIVINIIL